MAAFLAGLCFRTLTTCKPGDREVTPIQMLVGGFVVVALLGLMWIAFGRRRG